MSTRIAVNGIKIMQRNEAKFNKIAQTSTEHHFIAFLFVFMRNSTGSGNHYKTMLFLYSKQSRQAKVIQNIQNQLQAYNDYRYSENETLNWRES